MTELGRGSRLCAPRSALTRHGGCEQDCHPGRAILRDPGPSTRKSYRGAIRPCSALGPDNKGRAGALVLDLPTVMPTEVGIHDKLQQIWWIPGGLNSTPPTSPLPLAGRGWGWGASTLEPHIPIDAAEDERCQPSVHAPAFTPPLTPPRQGEGNPSEQRDLSPAASRGQPWPCSPSPQVSNTCRSGRSKPRAPRWRAPSRRHRRDAAAYRRRPMR